MKAIIKITPYFSSINIVFKILTAGYRFIVIDKQEERGIATKIHKKDASSVDAADRCVSVQDTCSCIYAMNNSPFITDYVYPGLGGGDD